MSTSPDEDRALRLEAVFERAPVAQVVVDDSHTLVAANREARTLFDIAPRDIGRPLQDLDLSQRPLELRPRIAEAFAERRRVSMRDVEWLSGTEARRLDVQVDPLTDAHNEPIGAAVTFVEVSHYRRLHELQVMQEFLRNAAHQLRTPLTAIATAVEVLQAGAKERPAERDRFLEHIAEHSNRMIRLTRGLLVLARGQSGERTLLDVIDIAPLLEELVHQASPVGGVELLVDCRPDVQALGHRDLAREAIAALVDNAVEHTRAGTIRLTAVPKDGYVSISVADEGGGIPAEHRGRIFEPFYRPYAGGSGHGLGLAIAAQAVQAMSGELTVEDSDGGARFTIRLPSASKRQ